MHALVSGKLALRKRLEGVEEVRVSRRTVLRTASMAAAAAALLPGSSLAADVTALSSGKFATVPGTREDWLITPPGFRVDVLLRWGDPILKGAPRFDADEQTPESQARQFGYNSDYLAFMPLPEGSDSSTRGLLWVNHESTVPVLMFREYDENK